MNPLISLIWSFALAASPPEMHWVDFEIVGSTNVSRDSIIASQDIRSGQLVVDLPTEAATSCHQINAFLANKNLAFQSCEFLVLSGGKAYIVVNMSDSDPHKAFDSGNSRFNNKTKLDPRLVQLNDDYMSLKMNNVNNSIAALETVSSDGTLVVSESKVQQLIESHTNDVKHAERALIACVNSCGDPHDRRAAMLDLNWIPADKNIQATAISAMRDPDAIVRNNASRYIMLRVDEFVARGDQSSLINSLIDQLSNPSHGDRNKAIIALKRIFEAHPNIRACYWSKAEPKVRLLSEQSVLPNVGGEAKILLALVKKQDSKVLPSCAG